MKTIIISAFPGVDIFFDKDNCYKPSDLYLIENKIEMGMD
jgi:hypothetical protein